MPEPTKGAPEHSRLVSLRRDISRLLTEAAEARAKGAALQAEELVARANRLAEQAAELELRA
jgi:hypothetical protein